METSPIQSRTRAADLPLECLASNTQVPETEKLAEVSRQFEAVLLRQVLSQAQKPAFPSRSHPQTVSSGIYQDMMTQQLADQITRSGGLGLGTSLQSQLTKQVIGTHETPSRLPDRHSHPTDAIPTGEHHTNAGKL